MKIRNLSVVIMALFLLGCGDTTTVKTAPTNIIEICASELNAALMEARRVSVAGCDWTQIDTLNKARDVQVTGIKKFANGKPIVGYKKTFANDGPVIGTLIEGMLLPSGTQLSRQNANRMAPEADILVRVSDIAINDVTSVEEALNFIDAAIPYLELSNPMSWEGAGRTQIPWTSTNGSARFGAMGTAIPMDFSDPDERRKFDQMRVTLTNVDGSIINDVTRTDSLLDGILVIIEELRTRGERLRKGQVLSLGNYGRPLMRGVTPGTYTVTYYGLSDEPVSSSITLTE